MKMEVPNLMALENHLATLIGFKPTLKAQIRNSYMNRAPKLFIESDDLKGLAGVLAKSYKRLTIETFGSDWDEERGYMINLSWRYELVKGGFNGIDLLTANCDAEGNWTFFS